MALTRPKYSNFVDNDFKNSCRIVTTTSITLSGGAPVTYDGVTLIVGDRVLVAGQSTGSQNGIYIVATLGTGSNGTWSRSFDASDGSRLSAGAQITIGEGTYGGRLWRLSTPDPITIGSTSLTFLDGAAIAGGSSTQLQFNNSGSLQGVSTLTYVSANTSLVSSGNVFAATLYTDQLRWAANSQAITLTGNINPVVYIGNTVIGTGVTLVDSFSAAGNTMVTWTTVSKDTNNTRYKKSTLDSFNDGSSISFTESAIIRSDSAYPVATFTSNITNGTINLWAAGDSASVTVTYERRVLGSFSPTGYINNFGPIGPAGSIAQTSSNIVTVATSTATSTTTGALQVAGGAGIAGNLYTGGNLVVGANLTVLGNLIVQGEVTTLNTTILAIEDLNITVAKDAVSSAAADGAGITVGGAGATFNYVASTDAWTSNKTIYASAYYTGGDTKWSGNSAVYRSGINYTPSATAPINSNYGDQWYDTTTDILYEWQTADGVNGFWIDIGSLAIVANANLSSTTFASITTGNVSASNVLVSNSLRITQSGAGNQYALTMKGSGSGDQWAFTVGSTVGQNNITSLNSAGSAYAPFSINGSTFTVGTTGAGATTSLSIDNAGNVVITNANLTLGNVTTGMAKNGYNVARGTTFANLDNVSASVFAANGTPAFSAVSGTMNYFWSAITNLTGGKFFGNTSTGGAVTTTPTVIGSSNGSIGSGGDTVTAILQDQDSKRAYQIIYMQTVTAGNCAIVITRIM